MRQTQKTTPIYLHDQVFRMLHFPKTLHTIVHCLRYKMDKNEF